MAEDLCKNTIGMAEWIKEESSFCRPCVLAPIIQWYDEELTEHNRGDLVSRLRKAIDQTDDTGLQVCKEMDRIKEEVDNELRTRLREFDCTIQVTATEL